MRFISFIFVFCFPLFLSAQDAHFSHQMRSAAFLSPALCGNFDAPYRASAIYRQQWATLGTPYRDFLASVEKSGKAVQVGGTLWGHDAGKASLRSTGFLATAAFKKALGPAANSLSLGVGLGFYQQRFDPLAFTYDSQYNPEIGYDATLGSNEDVVTNNNLKLDANIGLAWSGALTKRLSATAGFSLSHLHQPTLVFSKNSKGSDGLLPMRFSNHVELRWSAANQITLIPFGWWMQQGKALNRAAGLRAEFGFSENTNVSLGAAYRKNDAAMLLVGMEHGIHSISLAYDINTSGLHSVTNSKGALELAYVVLFGKKMGKNADQDKDGIPDEEDDCPTVKGAKSNKGCPPTGVDHTDGDGVIDTRDDCPTDPGLVMLGGCNDKDGDGIRDMDDRCPNLPGDKAAQGCPLREMDYDNDGILDMDDKCPYVTGLAALQGCPDTDGDGVSDLQDRCPYLKGDALYNGCPTGDAPAVIGNTEEHVIVEFETNKWDLAQRFNPLLDRMVAWLYQHPEKKIIITGHTDAEGDATSNYLLGIHRSQEVQNYFIQRRISPERIKVISYGETIPKSENTSAYGKARNRRVEVLVVE